MASNMRQALFVGSVVGVIALGGAALAQTVAGSESSVAEARIAWAKRHVEMVCRPLEAQRLSARAAKCYEEVSIFIADPRRPIPADVAAKEPAKPAAPKAVAAKPVMAKPVATAPVAVPPPVAAAPVAAAPVAAKPAIAKVAAAKVTSKKAIRTAARRRLLQRRLVAKPFVVASNERVANALAAAQDSVSVRRCGSLPCSTRFTTILGVGF